jgi:hypothetical protein
MFSGRCHEDVHMQKIHPSGDFDRRCIAVHVLQKDKQVQSQMLLRLRELRNNGLQYLQIADYLTQDPVGEFLWVWDFFDGEGVEMATRPPVLQRRRGRAPRERLHRLHCGCCLPRRRVVRGDTWSNSPRGTLPAPGEGFGSADGSSGPYTSKFEILEEGC